MNLYLNRIFLLSICFNFYSAAEAMDAHVQKKYPNVLITGDYGILNENDLGAYARKTTGRVSFAQNSKNSYGHEYWQCFPTEKLSVTLSTSMNNPDTDGTHEEMLGEIEIIVNTKNSVHEYVLRRNWPTSIQISEFADWYRLIQREKYICLGGVFFGDTNKKIIDGKKKKTYIWVFDKIKTKNGCLSYFSGECVTSSKN